MPARMLYLRCLSPLHIGTGQASGVIDLPVAREVHTNWPYIPASSLKGTLRDVGASQDGDRRTFDLAFGRPPRDEQGTADQGAAGWLWFSNGQLLAFPVRSYFGTFAWLSCPLAVRRWRDDLATAGATTLPPLPSKLEPGEVLVAESDCVIAHGGAVYLEDYRLTLRQEAAVGDLADALAAAALGNDDLAPLFRPRFGIVHDDLFTFLVESTTEVVARIALEDAVKTVRRGGLWYEESVPEQAIFACPLLTDPRAGDAGERLYEALPTDGTVVQLGGDASIGRGRVALRVRGV